MKLIFDYSNGFSNDYVAESKYEKKIFNEERQSKLKLPQVAECEVSRHFQELSRNSFGLVDGFYPLGSCTMKYNPALAEKCAAFSGFTDVHPLTSEDKIPGISKLMTIVKSKLCAITGMDDMTLRPAAGAHGEFQGLLIIKSYHTALWHAGRKNILVPDSAHGTNPASCSMCGFNVVNIKSDEKGFVDIQDLKAHTDENTAGLMLTNPNTLGLFDKNILEITQIIHEAGGLCYYDGANLNAIAGIVRPGDMGFDIVHLNLHKTFATPHGGGGPGSGPVGFKEFLKPYFESVCNVKAFYGNFTVIVKALCYLLYLGGNGVRASSEGAVLNANYMKSVLCKKFKAASKGHCMHEFVVTLEDLKKETGVSALDMAKALLDNGMHPPTMYFPLIIHEALMFEPTETETKSTMDKSMDILLKLYDKAYETPEDIKNAPVKTVIGRVDEVMAARKPVLKAY